MRKITFTDQYGAYTIELAEEQESLHDVFRNLILPGLRAVGFSSEAIFTVMDSYSE